MSEETRRNSGVRPTLPRRAAMAAALTILAVGLSSACAEQAGGGDAVEYRVTGTAGSVDLTLYNAQGGQEQHADQPLPVNLSMGDFDSDVVPYVLAQNTGPTGDLTCEIVVSGEVVATSSATGGYAQASCRAD